MEVNMSSLSKILYFYGRFLLEILFLETLPLISLERLCYRLDRATFSSKGRMRGQYVFLMAKHSNLYGRFIFPLSSASYLLKMSMLISLFGTLTQARMGVGSVTFLSKGPMRGQYVFPTTKYTFSISVIISADSVPYFLKMIMLINSKGTLTQTRMGIDRVTFYS